MIEARQLINWIKEQFNDYYPIILTGDFNVIPSSQTVKIIKSEFIDLWEECNKNRTDPGNTFSTKDPVRRIVIL